MKKTAAWILLLLSLFLLSGCNKKASKLKVGICLKEDSTLDASAWQQQLENGGCEITVMPPQTNQAKQMEQVTELSAQEYDLLIIEPLIPSVAEEIMQPAQEAGIPVLFVNYQEQCPSLSGKVSFIGYNAETPGLLQAKLLETLPSGGDLNGDGTVSYTVLTGPIDLEDVENQLSGITASLGEDALLCTKYTDWSKEKAYGMCTQLLSSYGRDVEVILCGSAELTESALSAVSDAGRIAGEDIYLIGMGSSQELSELIREGYVAGTIQEDDIGYDDQIVTVALAMLQNKPYETQYLIGYKTVTAD